MRRKFLFGLSFGPFILLAHPVAAQEIGPPPQQDVVLPAAPEVDDEERGEAPDTPRPVAELSAEARAAAASINRLTLDLFRADPRRTHNLVMSPASISMAMGIAYRGAQGQTATEIARVLHYGAAPSEYTRSNGELMRSLTFGGRNYRLSIANSLFVQDYVQLRPDFLADMTRHYDAGLQRVDFRDDPEGALATINGWVSDRTNGRIPDLLARTHIQPTTRLALVNAIYWRGRWAEQFSAAATREEPFTLADGTQQPAQLMNQLSSYQIVERGGVQAISLPFANAGTEMLVFLPRRHNGLTRFEQRLTDAELTRWLAALDASEQRRVQLTLPRFSLRAGSDGRALLQGLGLEVPFSCRADFLGIADANEPDAAGFQISNIVHRATVDVDEQGAEATAATAVIMSVMVTGSRRNPPPPIIFRADRPFLFLIRDRRSGTILFIGRYVDPAADQPPEPARAPALPCP